MQRERKGPASIGSGGLNFLVLRFGRAENIRNRLEHANKVVDVHFRAASHIVVSRPKNTKRNVEDVIMARAKNRPNPYNLDNYLNINP